MNGSVTIITPLNSVIICHNFFGDFKTNKKHGNPVKSMGFRILFLSADGGIRTLVPRRANAFRVRPVMTTSIRLQML